jgi:hypothetical protein
MRMSLVVACVRSLVAVTLIVATACDPCSGVGSCVTAPRLALEGTIFEHLSGLAQPGVRVDVIRTGGVELDSDSTSAITDARGHWQISMPAQSAGDAVVDVNVRSPVADYRVRGLHFATTERRGDGNVLEPWVTNPYFPYTAELHYRTFQDSRVAGATLEFHRTGGIDFHLNGSDAGGEYSGVSDAAGRVILFDLLAHARSLGDLVGDIIVHLPAPLPPDTTHGVTLSATQLLRAPPPVVIWIGAGPSLFYIGEFHERRSGKPAPGVQVTFQRTGGVPTIPETFSATTDAAGRFAFPLRPLADGAVMGDLHVVPPAPGTPFTLSNLHLDSFRDNQPRLFGVWNEGPSLPWVGLVQIGGRGIEGIDAEFHRTSGIQVQPADYTTQSDANGYIQLNPQPQDTGFVEADIVVHSPAPFPPFKTHVRLHTVEDDVSGGLAAVWALDANAMSIGAPAPLGKRSANARDQR